MVFDMCKNIFIGLAFVSIAMGKANLVDSKSCPVHTGAQGFFVFRFFGHRATGFLFVFGFFRRSQRSAWRLTGSNPSLTTANPSSEPSKSFPTLMDFFPQVTRLRPTRWDGITTSLTVLFGALPRLAWLRIGWALLDRSTRIVVGCNDCLLQFELESAETCASSER